MPFFIAARRLLGATSGSSPGRARPPVPAGTAGGPQRRGHASLALALLLAMAAVGCAAQTSVTLPRKSQALAEPSALGSPQLTRRQQVAAAYTGYWLAFAAAMSSQNAARARAILVPYDPPSAIALAVKADRKVWAAHETAYGSAVPHILSVRVTGNRALLHDCLDLSHFGAQDVRTGRVVPESFGLQHLNFYITLMRTRGRWLVSNMQPVEVPCGS
jgi:hypothetical protein